MLFRNTTDKKLCIVVLTCFFAADLSGCGQVITSVKDKDGKEIHKNLKGMSATEFRNKVGALTIKQGQTIKISNTVYPGKITISASNDRINPHFNISSSSPGYRSDYGSYQNWGAGTNNAVSEAAADMAESATASGA